MLRMKFYFENDGYLSVANSHPHRKIKRIISNTLFKLKTIHA